MAAQVLDSPFARLKDLMVELCEEQKLPIPRAFMRIALSMMRRSVRRRANFSIDEVSPLDIVPGSFIPALFGAQLWEGFHLSWIPRICVAVKPTTCGACVLSVEQAGSCLQATAALDQRGIAPRRVA